MDRVIKNRRSFLKEDIFLKLISFFEDVATSYREGNKQKKEDYFESFESCYPLLSEAPMEFLLDAAEKKGIETKGKSKLEIARELFESKEKRTKAMK